MSIGSVYETAYKGDFNQVKVKIDQEKSLLHAADSNGRLLIHWAALGGNENLVDHLIAAGSPVNPLDDTNSSPLILASSAGRYQAVRVLLGRGAHINQKTNRGQSALHYACSKGHREVVKLLLESDAKVNEVDILGATPLHRAAAQGRNEIVDILLCLPQINVNISDSTGSTPLHLACEEDREHVSVMLVKGGAKLDSLNKEKKTPLDLCSSKLKAILSNLLV